MLKGMTTSIYPTVKVRNKGGISLYISNPQQKKPQSLVFEIIKEARSYLPILF